MWQKARLGDVTEMEYGYTASAREDAVGPKLLRITDIVPDSIDWDSVPYCEINDNEYEKFKLQKGDIVVARTGATAGYAKLIRKNEIDVVFASYLIRIRPIHPELFPDYLGRLIESKIFKRFVESQKGGSAQPQANAPVLKDFSFSFPEKRIQLKISNILSAYDDLIENNNRRIALLEVSMRLLYREWFVRLRFPGHEHVRVVDGLPEGWEMKPLEEICDLTMGQSPPSDTYNINGDGLPFHQGVTRFGDRFISHEMYCTSPNRVAEPGDILFSVRAPVGRINITLDKIIIGRGLSAIRSKTGNQSFLYYQLKEHFFKEDLLGSGAIFASVTKKELSNELLLNPKNEIIAAFEEISKPIDQQITNLNMQNIRLSEARDLLLPRLMSGEIDVS